MSHIVYFEFLLSNILKIVSEICIGRRFLEDCFCCYYQQITPAKANESLIPHNLIKKHQKYRIFNTVTPNAAHLKPNLKNVKYSSVFRTKDFVPHKC